MRFTNAPLVATVLTAVAAVLAAVATVLILMIPLAALRGALLCELHRSIKVVCHTFTDRYRVLST
jgi:hypothetical protein